MPFISSKSLPYLSLLVATALWSSSFIALKLAFRSYDPMVVIFGRMAIASLFFLFFWKYFRNIKIRKQDWFYILLMAFCEPCLYFIFEAKALEYTSASQAGMITSILPLLVAIFAWLILKEKITLKAIIGFIIAIIGVCILSAGSEITENAPNPILGNFLEFLAMLSAAGYTIVLKRLSANYSALFLTAIQAIIGTLFYFPLLFLPETVPPTQFVFIPAFAVFYLGVFVTFGAYGAYNYAVNKIPANQAAAFINLIPAFTVVQGYLILNERLTVYQLGAMLIVFLGVFISQQKKSVKGQTKTENA